MNIVFVVSLAAFFAVAAKEQLKTAAEKVERDYLSYNKKLEKHHHNLERHLKEKAPELLPKLSPPPSPLTPGYQLLPKLKEEDEPREKAAPNSTTTTYSWQRTEELLSSQVKDLDIQVDALKTVKNLNYENLIENYRALDENQQIVGSHIEYNKLWQDQIVHYREKYDENNKLLEQLNSGKETHAGVVTKILKKLMSDPHQGVQLKKDDTKVSIQVALVTDIEDKDFIKTFEEVIEKFWKVKEGEFEYGVELKLRFVSPENLYLPDKPPTKGSDIDIMKHVEHFPKGEIVLTTGTGTTYYSVHKEPFIAVGVSEIAKRVLAHEFGHVLTLNDAYFRAYKDMKKSGFEIYEVIPDYTDIMAAPGYGVVKKHHFDLVIEALENRKN